MRRTEAECATKMAWLSAWNDVMAANWNCDDRVCQLMTYLHDEQSYWCRLYTVISATNQLGDSQLSLSWFVARISRPSYTEFHPDPIWNDGASGVFEEVAPTKGRTRRTTRTKWEAIWDQFLIQQQAQPVAVIADHTAYDVRYSGKLSNRCRLQVYERLHGKHDPIQRI